MLIWELIGAAVGAGFASGREIAVFFAQYGWWGYAGLAAAGLMLLLAGEPLPSAWKERWPEKAWQIMLSLLLITTGGAMLAGAGEIFSQVLPIRWSSGVGIVVTMSLGWLLAVRTKAGLAWVSRGLVATMTLLLLAAFFLSPMRGTIISEQKGAMALISGASYGGFNAALQWTILSAAMGKTERRRSMRCATVIILMMLGLGMLLMQRNAALMDEAMPFLVLMKQFGSVGYVGFILCLYLAVLSTLTACIRAVEGRIVPVALILLISCCGFGGVVNQMYPVLGGACCILLLLAKITNSFTGSFLSRKDML